MSPKPPSALQSDKSPLLVQLVAPGRGGVRDYLEGLRGCWLQDGIDSHVIELSQADAARLPLARRLLALAPGSGTPISLLLHYSGYGYDKRGLCQWLLQEVAAARTACGPRLQIITMFHELFASGPPWRSAFWLSRIQASIASRLAQGSDGLWTNTAHHARWLGQQTSGHKPLQVMPVFSTVGEPEQVLPMARRARRVVVFGAASTRARALDRLPTFAPALLQADVREVIEAGSGDACGLLPCGLAYHHLGRLESSALRSLLEGSIYGLIDYPSVHLGKSTVFAGYAVHGCVVLNTAPPGPDADGLQAGLHYHALAEADARWPVALQSYSDSARSWYAEHPMTLQARAFARSCGALIEGNRDAAA